MRNKEGRIRTVMILADEDIAVRFSVRQSSLYLPVLFGICFWNFQESISLYTGE
jgi:hypothetical protein